jgi:hypothetical protein
MSIYRTLIAAGALLLLLPSVTGAQSADRQMTQLQLQYHRLVPAGTDATPVFQIIFDQIRKDCERVATAFDNKCVIKQINIYSNAHRSGQMAGATMLNATATIVLPAEEDSASPPSPTK